MKALFITTNDLRRKSIIGGAVDADKFIQFVEVAQDIHIQNYLGTKLYEKIEKRINIMRSLQNALFCLEIFLFFVLL